MNVVQFGTNNGNDHVRDFCKKYSPTFIVLVEPFAVHNAAIKRNYAGIKNVVLENVAITPTEIGSQKIYYADADGPISDPTRSFEVTSLVPEHLIKHKYKPSELKYFVTPCKTVSRLFDTFSMNRIDYLFIDVEGLDFEILESIDFERYDIRNLQIEHIHLDREKLLSFMTAKGYTLSKTVGTTTYDSMFHKE